MVNELYSIHITQYKSVQETKEIYHLKSIHSVVIISFIYDRIAKVSLIDIA